jgi:ribosomal protein S18 acetylase RimI-like enzyme
MAPNCVPRPRDLANERRHRALEDDAKFAPALALGDSTETTALIGPWLLSAWRPYADELFGGTEEATAACSVMMLDRSSELSMSRAEVLTIDGRACGALITKSGSDLKHARRNDLLRMIQRAGRTGVKAIRQRLASLEGLIAPIRDDAFYLTHIAVSPAEIGHGFGRLLLLHFLEQGRSRGFSRFRLNVDAANSVARHLYSSAGFKTIHEGRSDRSSLAYLTMELVEEAPP